MAANSDNNEQPSMDQLDTLLEEASALAEDLSLEIAGEDPFLGIEDFAAASEEPTDDDASIPSVDEQLETVDELLTETKSVLGGESAEVPADEASSSIDGIPDFIQDSASPAQDKSESAAPTDESPEASVEAIPDFMQEFTQTPAGEDASPTPQPAIDEPSTSVEDIPDFMADLAAPESAQAESQDASTSVAVDDIPKPGQVGTSFEDTVAEPMRETVTIAGSGSMLSRISKMIPFHLIKRVPVAQIRDRVLALTIKIVEKAVDLLEVADRPTQKIGFKPRQLIGLVAISTLGTALVVFVISMF